MHLWGGFVNHVSIPQGGISTAAIVGNQRRASGQRWVGGASSGIRRIDRPRMAQPAAADFQWSIYRRNADQSLSAASLAWRGQVSAVWPAINGSLALANVSPMASAVI